MPEIAPVVLLAALGLAAVHLVAGKLRFLAGIPRSRWLSLAGGASVAYVFVHLLPELAAHQATVQERGLLPLGFLEHHVYLVALLGLATFYGLERLVAMDGTERHNQAKQGATSAGVFWLHIGSFAIYNALIGYVLIHREEPGRLSLTLFFVAMALHFLVNDYGLREHHQDAYSHSGRWILAVAVLIGWAIGVVTEIDPVALAVLVAFIAGGTILNVLKEELPKERESRFGAFALGAAAYAAIVISI